MPKIEESREWIKRHSGALSTQKMSQAIERIAVHLNGSGHELALEKIAQQEDPFHVLVGCIISLRTKDEVTDVAASRLLARAPTPDSLLKIAEEEISRLIYPAGFYRRKAQTLRAISLMLLEEFEGRVPSDIDSLLMLPGVGRKTANLVRAVGHGLPAICVDTHVHRICNRLDYVLTHAPDETEQVLRSRLPPQFWVPINALFVAFGRQICVPISPHCSTCPIREGCRRVGVGRSR